MPVTVSHMASQNKTGSLAFKLESALRVAVTVSHMASQNKTGSLAHYYKQLMQVPVLGGWGICMLPTHVQLVRDVGG